jgi:hypothetical protein
LLSASASRAGALLVYRGGLLAEHLAEPRGRHEKPAAELQGRQASVSRRLVCGRPAEANDSTGLLDAKRRPRAPVSLCELGLYGTHFVC